MKFTDAVVARDLLANVDDDIVCRVIDVLDEGLVEALLPSDVVWMSSFRDAAEHELGGDAPLVVEMDALLRMARDEMDRRKGADPGA